MHYQLNVANIKSNGCANTICSTLNDLEGVNATVVNITNGAVFVEAIHGLREKLSSTLLDLGYPETFESNIYNTFSTKAKSLVSCVKGRLHLS